MLSLWPGLLVAWCLYVPCQKEIPTRNFLTFVNTTAIACHQNPEALVVFLPVCNSSRVYKRQKITSSPLQLLVSLISRHLCRSGSGP